MILDSNIVIYSIVPEYESLRNFLKEKEYQLAVSVITKLEVLGYHRLAQDEKEILTHFFAVTKQIPISEAILEKAIHLKQLKKMSIGDAIIAATAILENDILLTNNEEDFENIEGLRVKPMKSI